MTYTKEQGKQKIKELVERFRYNLDVYKKSTYNETQVRREFIDPFFDALDWDVSNKQGYAEQYKEVVHEDTIKVGRSTRAPDYSFRVGGQRKFFVEAKKPAVNIKEDVSPSYQLRRYAWSAKLPLSIVTDFEELSVFNCQIKPNPTDKPSIGRIAYYTFDEYLDKFDEIYSIFSKEAVLKGSFDRYAQSTKGKKGTAEVDREFLKEIESWREMLAKNIALRNPDVSIYELNYAVQKIIDRIIFLRICEDRGIEPYGQLQTNAEGKGVYTHLLNHFKLAESKYNSGIFNFDTDKITGTLTIDDKVLKTIIQSLYYPKSPYEFSVFGVEILGNVYEQFLGKVIWLTAGHQAKVETKPEVKKAGGVYYTPQYIVEYIVENTVGKLIAGKTPEEIAHIKILDPACGSGSFLIGAYTYLLRYHLDWYTSNQPKRHKEAVFQAKENEWYLTTAEKKRILLDNIFGVDIDSQAVEVTKMSLLLKVLEHESRESIDQQAKLGLEGVLPNLGDNIKCGNSLIGSDFYDSEQGTLFDEEEMRRINFFDWDDDVKGFGGIMRTGGFDCVIGNPPYVRSRNIPQNDKTYYMQHFFSASRLLDTYYLFLENGIKLLHDSGRLSFIIPNGILTNKDSEKIRQFIVENTCVEIIVDLKEGVFKNAAVDTSIIAVKREKSQSIIGSHNFAIGTCLAARQQQVTTPNNILPQKYLTPQNNFTFNTAVDNQAIDLIQKISVVSTKLSNLVEVRNGMKVRKDLCSTNHEDNRYHKFLLGRNVLPFYINWDNLWVCYDKKLERKYSSQAFREERIFQILPKLFIRQVMGKRIYCSLDQEGFYADQTIYLLLPKTNELYSPKYLLGILSSSLIAFYFLKTSSDTKQTFPKIKGYQIEQLPIHTIGFSNPAEKAQHDKLVALVENILELKRKYHEARMERDKELYERQIKRVDTQIDRLVYDLYGLTEEEIEVVEKING